MPCLEKGRSHGGLSTQRHYQSLLGGIRGPTHSSLSADAQRCGKASFMDQQTSQYSGKLAITSASYFVHATFQHWLFSFAAWESVTGGQLLNAGKEDPQAKIPRATLKRGDCPASILHLALATPPLAAARPMTVPHGASCAADVTAIPENTAERSRC